MIEKVTVFMTDGSRMKWTNKDDGLTGFALTESNVVVIEGAIQGTDKTVLAVISPLEWRYVEPGYASS